MNEKEAVEYIEHYGWSTTRLGLGRTRELLKRLGNPQKRLKFVHVAGSNGKGSTCAMLSLILQKAGYRTGLYISPYIQEFCERIQIDGENISGEELARITERVRDAAEAMDDHPSQFELVTAIAMVYYFEHNCDIVVLEVGMGGELDSTNVIDAPEVAVITNICLDHTEYLGDTLEKIALTKAGIIKPGCRAVCYDAGSEVTEVIKSVCQKRGVPLCCVDFDRLVPLSSSLDGQRFSWDGAEYPLALLGPHQLYNAAVVLDTVSLLRECGWEIPEKAVLEGLRDVRWPARFERILNKPLVILDGGHNPQGADALAACIRDLLRGRKVVFLLGILADKDYRRITSTILPYAQEFICLTPENARALPGEELAVYLRQKGAKASAYNNLEEGIHASVKAAGMDGAVIAFGSLYLVGAIRTAFSEMDHE